MSSNRTTSFDDTKHLTEADSIAELATQSIAPQVLTTDETVVALADGAGRVRTVDLEQYQEHPRRATGQRTVYDAGSFAAYLHRHETAATEVFADVQAAEIVGLLDSHEPARGTEAPGDSLAGWQQHKITLKLTQTPAWLAWTKHDGDFLPQAEFAEFAEERAEDVREPSPADLLELAQRLEMTKGVEYVSGQRQRDGQTQLVYKETMQAKAGERGDLEIPQFLVLALRPYVGGPTYGVRARFRYRLRGTALVLGYVLERPDLILESAFGDVVDSLREGQETTGSAPGYEAIDAPIFLGKP